MTRDNFSNGTCGPQGLLEISKSLTRKFKRQIIAFLFVSSKLFSLVVFLAHLRDTTHYLRQPNAPLPRTPLSLHQSDIGVIINYAQQIIIILLR
ncbi:hypothetical protein ASPWEDRAFT_432349 [Aspergillus wentii DTO 134E9]|uniref:Uncharacterized protein n=1 Tax=Aspergillus wentii DTO 134E9 TaxID=1073089 RepID=A0A1L9RPK9_ASPWE|nr:uncharacterized protein ASPWEDRAFT_432349 [Aspergillus wentii DTO 134E9]OJJ36869.1 hypothetical protein ASPWEDRAFT_432349 [Aspergillus wentii DTO 134E9]